MPRVNELLREVIAEELRTLKDPEIGFITVTAVDTSPDLRTAHVFYTAMGSEEEQAACSAALQRATPHIRARLGAQVRLKYTPAIEFRVDQSMANGFRIDSLLRDIGGQNE
ncbi:MAG: 30S ribosome-binding factor RbfA [Acidimicrobiia bacterium]|nr:30S ribosome-binding factor RbfA [Acidimicrobiia bacterium]